MSLLLNALKQAELEKRKREQAQAGVSAETAGQPPLATHAPSPAPQAIEPTISLQPVSPELADVTQSPTDGLNAVADSHGPAAASSVDKATSPPLASSPAPLSFHLELLPEPEPELEKQPDLPSSTTTSSPIENAEVASAVAESADTKHANAPTSLPTSAPAEQWSLAEQAVSVVPDTATSAAVDSPVELVDASKGSAADTEPEDDEELLLAKAAFVTPKPTALMSAPASTPAATVLPVSAPTPGPTPGVAPAPTFKPEVFAPGPAAAQAMFTAKQPAKKSANRVLLLATGGLVLLTVAAAAGLWFIQKQQGAASSLALAPANGQPAAGAQPTPTPTDAAVPANPATMPAAAQPDATAAATQPVQTVPVPAVVPTPATGAVATATPANASPATQPPAASNANTSPTPASVAAAMPVAPRTSDVVRVVDPAMKELGQGILISRTQPAEVISPQVSQAYQAYQQADYSRAAGLYKRALKDDERNRDALLGLAVIAQRQGQSREAIAYYQKLLELDPKDSTARQALAVLNSSPQAGGESALQEWVRSQPGNAQAAFALAGFYARQNRWAEAQPWYFSAMTLEPENPDYHYNLAVALDHLSQPKLALQYYQQAIPLALQRQAGFNSAAIARRVEQLQSALAAKE